MISDVRSAQLISVKQKYSVGEKGRSGEDSQISKNNATALDVVEIGSSCPASVTYTKESGQKPDITTIEALKQEAEKATENLRTLVEKLILQQSRRSGVTNGGSALSIDEKTVQQAKEAIAEDGDFGVKAVSDRIVSFAIAVSGGDTAKLDELKAAINQGFSQATKSFGGELPDICNQTYNEIMRKLDEWGQGGCTGTN